MSKLSILALFLAVSAVAQERPIDIVFVLEDAPGTEQSISLLNRRAFEKDDRVAVVTLTSGRVQTVQSLTDDRKLLARALQNASTRGATGVGAGASIAQLEDARLAVALETAVDELANHATAPLRAILLLYINQDPDLPSRSQILQSNLESAHVRLYAVHIPAAQGATPTIRLGISRRPPTFSGSNDANLKELTEATGGRLYVGPWDLRDVVKHLKAP